MEDLWRIRLIDANVDIQTPSLKVIEENCCVLCAIAIGLNSRFPSLLLLMQRRSRFVALVITKIQFGNYNQSMPGY